MQLSLLDLLFPKRRKKVQKRRRREPSSVPPRKKRRPLRQSDERLKSIWCELREQFFPDRPDLDQYTDVWSNRKQLRTLASCSIENKRILVARELNYPEHSGWLSPLLYHEMCHAFLGYDVSENGNGKAWHGPEFKKLERAHPHIPALDRWIKEGGWTTAVRSDRAKRAHQKRKAANS